MTKPGIVASYASTMITALACGGLFVGAAGVFYHLGLAIYEQVGGVEC